jgi:hypothetical protein
MNGTRKPKNMSQMSSTGSAVLQIPLADSKIPAHL